MSREDAVVLASRTLAVLFTVWALAEICNLPSYVQSYLHYLNHLSVMSPDSDYSLYWRHHYLIDISFVLTKVVGFSLVARWLYKGGPDVADLLLPTSMQETSASN